ncbi:MAG: hypothetical protein GX640_00815 [Fibrobacter sp.]|nr:hypothetical protein [Fibrobacter sp.]
MYSVNRFVCPGVVSAGAVLTILGLNGEVVYGTVISGTTVTLPSEIKNRAVVWRVSHNSFSVSGKLMALGR